MSVLATPPWVPARKRAKLVLTVPAERAERILPFPEEGRAHHAATRIPAENDRYAALAQTARDAEILGLIAARGILPIYAARYLSEEATLLALEKADLRFLTHYRIPQIALERFGTTMIGPLTEAFPRAPEPVHEAFLAVDAIRVAELYLDKFAPLAGSWFTRHPETAAFAMIPTAISGKAKDSARALRAIAMLIRTGHGAAVGAAAAYYGETAEEELRTLLLPPPLPPKPPELPSFLDIATLPVPRRGETELPPEQCLRLLQLLALLPLGAARAAVLSAKRELDPPSVAPLARALVDRWAAAEAPTSDKWVLLAAALLGDDLVAHQLATNVTTWAELGQHTRATAGVEALRHLGSNLALTLLARFAAKSKHGAVKKRARAALAEYREEHHLSEDELADRLVPTLDLDPRGELALSYGPRSFRVVFDATLKATLRDGDQPLRLLPKALSSDDPALVARAAATWNVLKVEAKTIIEAQVRRLERAMNTRRRWTREEFDVYLHKHPLMQQIARRLVWGAFDATDALGTTFRIAEDSSLSNAEDETTTIDDGARFGVVHPFAMGAELAARWGNVFGDYEIVQPFPQLAREVRALAENEKAARLIHRFEGRLVEGARFFSLPHRGWTFLDYDLGKVVAGGRFVVLETEPGVALLTATPPEQTLGVLSLRSPVPDETFAVVDAFEMSEVLRDVEMLAR